MKFFINSMDYQITGVDPVMAGMVLIPAAFLLSVGLPSSDTAWCFAPEFHASVPGKTADRDPLWIGSEQPKRSMAPRAFTEVGIEAAAPRGAPQADQAGRRPGKVHGSNVSVLPLQARRFAK
jgi:hypothetical protein